MAWLLAEFFFFFFFFFFFVFCFFFVFVLFVVLCLVDPVWQCDNIFGGKRELIALIFLWSVACVLSAMVCFLFLGVTGRL